MAKKLLIRIDNENDIAEIFAVNKSAFETKAEAKLVDKLRIEANPIISLVAIVEEKIIGHIMFSPVTLFGFHELKIFGLAPMAVTPKYQNQKIGSALVEEGLKECKKLKYSAVVVLGHPEYYPRFGFVPSTTFGFVSEYKVEDKYFMAQELREGALNGKSGIIRYHAAFSSL